jgi:hypothetical protein
MEGVVGCPASCDWQFDSSDKNVALGAQLP